MWLLRRHNVLLVCTCVLVGLHVISCGSVVTAKIVSSSDTAGSAWVCRRFWQRPVCAVLDLSPKGTTRAPFSLLCEARRGADDSLFTGNVPNSSFAGVLARREKRPPGFVLTCEGVVSISSCISTLNPPQLQRRRQDSNLPKRVASVAASAHPPFVPPYASSARPPLGMPLQKSKSFLLRSAFSKSRLPNCSKLIQHFFNVSSPCIRFSTMAHSFADISTHSKQEEAAKRATFRESVKQPIPLHGSDGGRIRIAALLSDVYAHKYIGKLVTICGWSRSVRKQGGGNLCFLVLSDGSGPDSLQVVVEASIGESFAQLLKCGAGCSFRVTGEVVKSPAKGQALEISVRDKEKGHSLEILGMADASKYPLAKKEHTREYLREIAHLRPRSHLIGAVTRVRSHLAMATHRFFQDRGFLYVHTPIITASDCEGAGEMFQVTTVLPAAAPASGSEKREDGTLTDGPEGTTTAAKLPPTTQTGEVDYSKDFFGRRAFLTVSGQLAVEPYCCALGDVYTFGPTFRAENSHTSRHLAEFWMVEPELAFATLEDNMRIAEEYVKYCVTWVLDNCRSDIEWFAKNQEEGLVGRLENILAKPFKRVSYTDAIELLKAASRTANFKESVTWGMDLGSEHERYLTEKIYEQPCIVHDYPKDIKAFYMKLNKDGKTVRAMDLLVPKIGELVGGSQREDDLHLLDKMIISKNLDLKDYWWYRELRSYGSVPHAGFGLGFERLVMLVTGIENIRDTIPYPRYPGHAEF